MIGWEVPVQSDHSCYKTILHRETLLPSNNQEHLQKVDDTDSMQHSTVIEQ